MENYPVTIPVYDNKKEGFATITEVRNFLYGHNNTKHSKVYVRIEQVDGYNALCIYLDNNLTQDEVTPVTDLNEVNGFHKFYQMKINKVEPDIETTQKIIAAALPEIAKLNKDFDVKEVFATLDKWVKEFSEYWNYEVIACEHPDKDFNTEVREFVAKKVAEYKKSNFLVAEPEYNEFLVETVQDITAVAVQIASKQEDGYDSRELFSECRGWAVEFEKMWNTYVEQGVEDDHDYMLEVEEFAEKKVNEYLEYKN
jgi:hypothetical protein